MRHALGIFVTAAVLTWSAPVLGQEYSFGNNSSNSVSYGASSANYGGKTGFYLAPRFLDSLTNTGDISGGGRSSKTVNSVGGALAGGFYLNRLDSRIPLRAEVEYAARNNVKASWDSSGSTGVQGFKALFNVQTLMANIYWDIDTGTPFRPFIGGGMGMSFIYADYKVNGQSGMSDYDTGFAWNAGAGVAYDINDTLTVDLAYRFAGFGYAEVNSERGHPRNYMTSNEFLLGMRINF